MKLFSFIIIFVATSMIIGCGGSGQQSGEEQEKLNITVEQLSSEFDPVCGMSIGQQPIADSAHYHGKATATVAAARAATAVAAATSSTTGYRHVPAI